MKNRIILSLLIFILSTPSLLGASDKYIAHFRKEYGLSKYGKKHIRDITVKGNASFFYTVLANTVELKIHQMRGAIGNKVALDRELCRYESVFCFDLDENGKIIDGTGKLVLDSFNQGHLNQYHPYALPMGHFACDMLFWFSRGHGEKDPGSIEERVEAYVLDFEDGLNKALASPDGFYLPIDFKFKKNGQSETYAFFMKALHLAEFNFSEFFPDKLNDETKRKEFLKAVETGFNLLLNEA